jgi:hypothetical protein
MNPHGQKSIAAHSAAKHFVSHPSAQARFRPDQDGRHGGIVKSLAQKSL